MTQPLKGKLALVTGSGRGIGRAIALKLVSQGSDIIVNFFRHRDTAEQTAKDVQDIGVKAKVIREGKTVYDPCVERHHHFIDEKTGEIFDIPWSSVKVTGVNSLKDFEVLEYHVVIRGRRKR